MHIITKLADRLLEKVAPTVTADAACRYLSTDRQIDGFCTNGTMGVRVRTTVHYDNCPPKVTFNC
ncbi:hypothetical protein Aca07nite_54100 [Actinoplanes capillaceus]|uniref:Uncharacterized protein n=1 Tax=Actinoplanes campanulatus TaxID=113559 RepID=A0ABQ3WPP2_9ACTN|nr:hypothetical protein [Actinoplanes capillaceus]GID48135.1 hypothetical protein Aca07nite_54100 [Actinoplanes capillaceus]